MKFAGDPIDLGLKVWWGDYELTCSYYAFIVIIAVASIMLVLLKSS